MTEDSLILKLIHDIENDLGYTIPEVGGWDSQWVFREMTGRSLALLDCREGERILDLACGMGQDTSAVAGGFPRPGYALGVEPSNRMIRFAQMRWREEKRGKGGGFVRALGEELPFADASFDGVLCKGSLDHFLDPGLAIQEIARVLKPDGRLVLALANYDSLSCRLGKMHDFLKRRWITEYRPQEHPYFNPPPDHLARFGYRSMLALLKPPLRVARIEGVSLLWGFPPWSSLLASIPAGPREWLLKAAFGLGSLAPAWADVIVLQARKKEWKSKI